MATGQANPQTISRKAGADLSASQYRFVKLDANGDVVRGALAADSLVGVLQNKPTSGHAALIQLPPGISKIKLGGTVAIGDNLTTDSAGRAVATTTATDNIWGQALVAGAVDEVGEILLQGPYEE